MKSLKIRVAVINYCDVAKNAANDIKGPYRQPKDAFGRAIPFLSILANGGIQTNVAGAPVYTRLNAGNGDNNRQDWWFYQPYGGSALYTDLDMQNPAEGNGLWSAAITVNNSAADTDKCSGTPVTYTVEPTGKAMDAYLTVQNTQPFTKAPEGALGL